MQNYTYANQFTTIFEKSKAKSSKTHKITALYIHGMYSDPWGRKPEAVKSYCEDNGIDFLRFELIGHGSDKDNYEKIDINILKAQVLEVIDKLTDGDLLALGSSLGGWLSLIAAIERPQRVKGIIGLAAAPDFTVDLVEKYFTKEQNHELEEQGRLLFTNNDFTYVFTKQFFDSGRQNQLLNHKLAINCPIHLLQGMKDASLDWRKAIKISECVESSDVTIKLLKESNHRLGKDEDLQEICASIESIVKNRGL